MTLKTSVRWLPLVVALLISAGFVLAQGTTYFGDILVLYRADAGVFPAATNYRGGIVYDLGSNTPWFSNGTAWQPISSGGSGGSGTSPWIDAGVGVEDGGIPAVFLSPVGLQARIGAQDISYISPYVVPVNPLYDPLRNPGLYLFADGGTPLTSHTRHNIASLSRNQFLANSNNFLGANLYLYSEKNVAGANYAQILFQATDNSAGTAGSAHDYIISYRGQPTMGGDGPFINGLNFATGTNTGMTFSTGGNTSSLPALYIDQGGLLAMGRSDTVSGVGLNLNMFAGVTTGIRIANSSGTGIAFQFANTAFDLGNGTNDSLSSDGVRITTPAGFNASNYRVVGNTNGTDMVTSTVSGNGGLGFRQADNQLYSMSTGKEGRPILSGADWALDGRVWNVDLNWENTACPVVRNTLIQASGGDVTVSCTDVVGGGSAVSPSGFPVRGYRTFNTNASVGARSGFSSGTMPASGASGTPQLFLQRRGGLVAKFWVRTGGSLSAIRWYSGLVSAIPSSGLPAPNAAVYVRYDTSVADARFIFCSVASTVSTCVAGASAPSINTEYLVTIDCRESSTLCRLYINGLFEATVTTNLPALADNMGFVFAVENTAASTNTMGMGRVSILTE